ncbi:glycosyltransferase [Pseudomonas sp. MDMC_285]|nr:glycosyltransferase [Pseudomonas sp. MDMC_285]
MSDTFYRALEERFRAPVEEIQRRLAVYRPFLQALRQQNPQAKAFDIGCGRGEWLQVVQEEGISAQGVDLDDEMLRACHEAGLQARNQDALTALRELPAESLDLVSAFHVVEHLEFDYLRAVIDEAHRVLRPGGLIIMETPNSENLLVGTNSFYLDPTHQRPVPSLFLEFLCQHHGFSQSNVLRLQEDPALHAPEASIGLWQVLYGASPDYAVIARKASEQNDDALSALLQREQGLSLQDLALRHDQQQQQLLQRQGQQLSALQAQVAQLAEHHARHAQHIEHTEALLKQIYSSRSWRITRPLRDITDLMRHGNIRGLTRYALRPLAYAIAWARRTPAVAGAARKVISRVPGLSARLQRLELALSRNAAMQESHQDAYAPQVVRLQRSLASLRQPERIAPVGKPRLAFVSPLPPEHTGIADYSAELLPALATHYRIDVIADQPKVDPLQPEGAYPIHDAAWLREHADDFDAVLYHIGNSAFHDWMVSLLDEVPGIVVLHDFYLSGLIWSLEQLPEHRGVKLRELQYSHGYLALKECLDGADGAQIAYRYPFNRSIIESATGIIVHSEVSIRLARQWYGPQAGEGWHTIPLLRAPAETADKHAIRQRLQLPTDAFIVCSYGQLGETKLNHRLLQAWLASTLAQPADSYLIFVGELGQSDYAQELRAAIARSGLQERIRITGRVDSEHYRLYLGAADIAVQLRSLSRGETSAAVLDCMNHCLPTIVNANGSMADLNADSVYRIADDFADEALTAALQTLSGDAQQRQALGQRARATIEQQHAPEHCAALYQQAISQIITAQRASRQKQLKAIGQLPQPVHENTLLAVAEQLMPSQPVSLHQPCIYIDITATTQSQRLTGIERVARALTLALLQAPPAGYRVEPVYLTHQGGRWHYRQANAYTCRMLGMEAVTPDRGIACRAGDRIIALDYSGESLVRASQSGLYEHLRDQGVTCQLLLHDLLPVTRPELFPAQSHQHFGRWLEQAIALDGIICVTRTVSEELRAWLRQERPARAETLAIDYSHHGADLSGAAPSRGLPENAAELLAELAARPTVLMVGTLEPRKGYIQALAAFTQLWQKGAEINLVIVGEKVGRICPTSSGATFPS